MSIKRNTTLTLLIAFAVGIVLEYLFTINWVILLTIWFFPFCLVVFILLWGRKNIYLNKWISFGLIAMFLQSGMLGLSFHLPGSYKNEFSSLYLENDQLSGTVVDFEKGKSDYNRVILKVTGIYNGYSPRKARGRLLCYVKNIKQPRLEMGDIILFQPQLQTIKNKGNPGEFNAERYWKLKGINKICFVSRDEIRVVDHTYSFKKFWYRSRQAIIQVINRHISPENRGVVIGMTMGDKSQLSIEQMHNYADAGAMYVLAVAGLQIGILLQFLEWLFRKIPFLRKRNIYLISALGIVWAFTFLTGMSASVLRASVMFSILALGRLLGKRYFSLRAIFFSALILLIINPTYLFNIGFQLTYSAIIGIAIFFSPLSKLFQPKNKLLNFVWQGLAIGITAEIGVVPLCLYYFHQFPNYFLLTNVVISFLSLAGMISVVLFLCVFYIPYLVDIVAFIVDFIFNLMNQSIAWINTLPAKSSEGFTPEWWQVGLIYISIILLHNFWKNRSKIGVKWGIPLVFFSALTLLIGREENKNSHNLIIFNSKIPTLAYQLNHSLYVVSTGKKEEISRLISGYVKTVGIHPTFIDLNKSGETVSIKSFSATEIGRGLMVNFKGTEYFLAKDVTDNLNDKCVVIKGAWNRFLPKEDVDINTMEGAFLIKIDSKNDALLKEKNPAIARL